MNARINNKSLTLFQLAAVESAEEVDGPGAAQVAPKYFKDTPEKITHQIIIPSWALKHKTQNIQLSMLSIIK